MYLDLFDKKINVKDSDEMIQEHFKLKGKLFLFIA